jgi:superfamily I DNA and/or RNA helicase
LLRRLIEQSEILRGRGFPLEVALPSRLHQRECDIVFLSLTRSHAHRCVAFGEDVKELPLALTRSRSRLLVFGDPGSLFKRASWHGPLDHLDASSAHQELLRLSRLLALLQKQGPALPLANGSLHGKE